MCQTCVCVCVCAAAVQGGGGGGKITLKLLTEAYRGMNNAAVRQKGADRLPLYAR